MQHLKQIKTKLSGHCPVMYEGEEVDDLAVLVALDRVFRIVGTNGTLMVHPFRWEVRDK